MKKLLENEKRYVQLQNNGEKISMGATIVDGEIKYLVEVEGTITYYDYQNMAMDEYIKACFKALNEVESFSSK